MGKILLAFVFCLFTASANAQSILSPLMQADSIIFEADSLNTAYQVQLDSARVQIETDSTGTYTRIFGVFLLDDNSEMPFAAFYREGSLNWFLDIQNSRFMLAAGSDDPVTGICIASFSDKVQYTGIRIK